MVIVVNPKSSFNREPYDYWLKRLDATLRGMCGMGVNMLPDMDYRAMYDKHLAVSRAARRVIKHARELL